VGGFGVSGSERPKLKKEGETGVTRKMEGMMTKLHSTAGSHDCNWKARSTKKKRNGKTEEHE